MGQVLHARGRARSTERSVERECFLQRCLMRGCASMMLSFGIRFVSICHEPTAPTLPTSTASISDQYPWARARTKGTRPTNAVHFFAWLLSHARRMDRMIREQCPCMTAPHCRCRVVKRNMASYKNGTIGIPQAALEWTLSREKLKSPLLCEKHGFRKPFARRLDVDSCFSTPPHHSC